MIRAYFVVVLVVIGVQAAIWSPIASRWPQEFWKFLPAISCSALVYSLAWPITGVALFMGYLRPHNDADTYNQGDRPLRSDESSM